MPFGLQLRLLTKFIKIRKKTEKIEVKIVLIMIKGSKKALLQPSKLIILIFQLIKTVIDLKEQTKTKAKLYTFITKIKTIIQINVLINSQKTCVGLDNFYVDD